MTRNETCDVVVVGAGSAGCVLANRLTEDGRTRVLLLEAGPRDTNPWIHVPLGYGKLFARTDVNWAYESDPEPALNGRRVFTPRGKVLGGSSSINGLVYIRGQREDFDGWGVPGWSFDDLLPYFIKSEDQSRGADAWHGAGGPLAVSDLPDKHELCDAFIASAAALGVARNDDFNGAMQDGAGYYQATTRNGRRSSAATGYLRPAAKRPNLRVEVNALATRVLFEGTRAVGVEYLQGGRRYTRARGARGDPRRRSVQLAAAAAALGRRPARAAREPGHRAAGRLARRRRSAAGPFLRAYLLALQPADHAQRRHGKPVAPARHRAALPALAARAADGERRLRRGVRAHPARARAARRPDLLHQFFDRQARRGAAPVLRLHRLGVAAAGRVARLGAGPLGRPARAARPSSTTTSRPRTTAA